MARNIDRRLTLSGHLTALTPLHVGGFGQDVDTDLPLARDGAGTWYVPGTSLAGALRAWCEKAAGPQQSDEIERIWGFQLRDRGAASCVSVSDASVLNAAGLPCEIRDSVGIDRQWGCAAEQIKFDRAVLPRGTRLTLELTVEFRDSLRDRVLQLFGSLYQALREGHIRLGAAKTRGLGKVRLEDGRLVEHSLSTREGILSLLRGETGQPVPAPVQPLIPPSPLAIRIHWHPRGPLMVKAGEDGIGVDSLPLVTGTENGLALVLPGSSIKGALRNQAERIVRTMLRLPLPVEDDPKQRFLRHLRDVPLVSWLFGAAGESEPRTGKTLAEKRTEIELGRGALAVDDCYGQERFSPDAWHRITVADPEAKPDPPELLLRNELDRANLPAWTAAFHVAVDRWTGGAAENLLYSVLEPHATSWEPIELAVDLERLPADGSQRLAAVALLLLTLRDLVQGRIPLGYATQRGMGAVAIDKIVFHTPRLPDGCDELHALGDLELAGGDLAAMPPELRDRLVSAWQTWLESQPTEVTA